VTPILHVMTVLQVDIVLFLFGMQERDLAPSVRG